MDKTNSALEIIFNTPILKRVWISTQNDDSQGYGFQAIKKLLVKFVSVEQEF